MRLDATDMAPTITFTEQCMTIRLRGAAAVGALRRRVTVPLRQITAVELGSLPSGRPTLWRVGGIALGDRLAGTFRRDGRWLFVAVHRRDRVVRILLDGEGPERVRFAEIVVSADDADALAARITEHARLDPMRDPQTRT